MSPRGNSFSQHRACLTKKENPTTATDTTTQQQSKTKHRNSTNKTSRPSLHINTSHCTQWGLLLRDVMTERIRFLALLHFRAMYLRPEGSEAYRTKKTSVTIKQENSNTMYQTFFKQHYVVSEHAKHKYWRGVVVFYNFPPESHSSSPVSLHISPEPSLRSFSTGSVNKFTYVHFQGHW